MSWTNSDGLVVLFGAEEATKAKGGEYPDTVGSMRVIEMVISPLTGLALTPTQVDDFVSVPKNSRIEKVEVVTKTAATSGGAAALNVGLYALDRTTPIAAAGLVSALALASINAAGKSSVLNVGSTSAGTLIGTTLSQAGLIFADYDTAAYTAGELIVRIYFNVL